MGQKGHFDAFILPKSVKLSMKSLLVFEPWNLGDLVIAANFARYINDKFDISISFICKPQWAEWLSSQNFVETVFTFEAPWTRIRGKYNPLNYNPKQIYKLSRFIKYTNIDLVWDVRGDVRQGLFLKTITTKKVYSPKYPKNINVYNRLSYFLKDNFGHAEIEINKKSKLDKICNITVISLFIDSYWPNRQLPYQKSVDLIMNLLSNGYFVKLIVPPNKDYDLAKELEKKFPNSFYLLKDSVVNIAEEIKKSDIMISTDSGWMHMAYYYNIPCIAMFGFDNHNEWAPPGTKIILAANYLPKGERYKLKYLNISPLETINISAVLKEIQEAQQENGLL